MFNNFIEILATYVHTRNHTVVIEKHFKEFQTFNHIPCVSMIDVGVRIKAYHRYFTDKHHDPSPFYRMKPISIDRTGWNDRETVIRFYQYVIVHTGKILRYFINNPTVVGYYSHNPVVDMFMMDLQQMLAMDNQIYVAWKESVKVNADKYDQGGVYLLSPSTNAFILSSRCEANISKAFYRFTDGLSLYSEDDSSVVQKKSQTLMQGGYVCMSNDGNQPYIFDGNGSNAHEITCIDIQRRLEAVVRWIRETITNIDRQPIQLLSRNNYLFSSAEYGHAMTVMVMMMMGCFSLKEANEHIYETFTIPRTYTAYLLDFWHWNNKAMLIDAFYVLAEYIQNNLESIRTTHVVVDFPWRLQLFHFMSIASIVCGASVIPDYTEENSRTKIEELD